MSSCLCGWMFSTCFFKFIWHDNYMITMIRDNYDNIFKRDYQMCCFIMKCEIHNNVVSLNKRTKNLIFFFLLHMILFLPYLGIYLGDSHRRDCFQKLLFFYLLLFIFQWCCSLCLYSLIFFSLSIRNIG